MQKLAVLLFGIIITSLSIGNAFGFGPNNQTCYEIGNCNFFEEPFNAMILPYQEVFGDFTFVIVWSIIIGILWLRLGNTMAVGIVGLALAALFQLPIDTNGDGEPELTPFSDDAQIIGFALLIVAVAVVLFQITTVRTHYPSN